MSSKMLKVRYFTILLAAIFFKTSHGQDTLFITKKKSIPVKIVSLNRTTVDYIPWNDSSGTVQQYRLIDLHEIKYKSGEKVNLNTWQKQEAIGLSYYIFPKADRDLDNGKYEPTEYKFKSRGLLFSYYYRGHVGGLVVSAGYAHTGFSYYSQE